MAAPRRITIRTGTIELGAFVKWAQAAVTGGEAKQLIQDGRVRVNGEVERRRGRQLHPGDRVAVKGQTFLVERSPA